MTRASRWARWGLGLGACALLATPLWIFWRDVRPFPFYLGDRFPPGQAAYVMMRPAGHLVFCLVFLQIVLGLQGRRLARWTGVPTLLPLHKALGLATAWLLLFHPSLFLWASLQRYPRPFAVAFRMTFLPDPAQDYWSYFFFWGALGFWGLLTAVGAALLGPRLAPRAWRWVHALCYPAFGCGGYHARAAGAEVRGQALEVLYTVMMGIVAALLAARLAGAVRARMGRRSTRCGAIPQAGRSAVEEGTRRPARALQ